MEHWQFLIQKQGDRSWHILESPNLEILEGEYRVLARSNLPNTDVEVRVTHSSTQEVLPKRRIFKRSRRTNSEGLMALIPFTYFEPGVWELRCMGDLMSELLGKSWQYSVQLQVLCQRVEGEQRKQGENVESNSSDRPDAVSENWEFTFPAEPAIGLDQATAVSAELGIATGDNPVTIVVPDEGNLEYTAPEEPEMTLDKAIAVFVELLTATDDNPVSIVVPDEENLEYTAPEEPEINFDKAIATDSNPVSIVVPDEENLEYTAPEEPEINFDKAIATEQTVTTDSNPNNTVLLDETEKDIDEPVNSVWLKGETAEQILQNLIDLALPNSEALLNNEQVTDSPATQSSPPLLLTLDRDTYIARWGQPLTINGYVELKEKINLDQAETLFSKSLQALELEIELRSPKNSKILTQVRQPLPDQELPFTINTSIDIPADFESKLILADITLSGRFADVDEVIRLASQSFTITADVTELLAITAAATPSTSLNDTIAPSDSSAAVTQPEAAVRIDLKLFNLVKIPKTDQSQIFNPSPNTALPPQINLQVLREAILRTSNLKNSGTSPQLPKLPPIIQTHTNTPTDVVAEPTTEEELLEKDVPMVAINLEQLVIKQRRMPILDTTLPYLKRLPALPDDTEKVKNNAPDAKVPADEDLPQLDTTVADENTLELVDDTQFQEKSVAEAETQPNEQFQEESVAEVEEAQPNAQFITTGNLYSSPLLRKWMHSQGYSLPESIDELEPEDHDRDVSAQQTQLSMSAETPNVDVNLPLNLDADTQTTSQEVQDSVSDLENFGEDADTAKEADIEIREDTAVEVSEPTLSMIVTQLPPPPPPIKMNIASAWLAQEIVVDDTYSEHSELEANGTKNDSFEEEKQPLLGLSSSSPITAAAIEPLPIPELHVPDGELIAGKFIIVRVVLPEVPPQVVVKLWLEDYQTRWLLEGPHLLTNLLPNALGGLEVMTQLNIPFGCLEVRLEAIALDLTTQQESHKVTIVRTVIPPDLPNLQLDELLDM
ncbi:hypothetical protein NIES4072_40490 [Nostoc commune NIES-4072]|uniref:Uncharacterized protein n=1 Tax=Nostoc commune NIES-4072 TaxID=2005467 RepID=A0A2R5FNM3_NOSCO|nr:hypothetical protein [Nostoc commune]BBD68636.1 hypothetical protein NIES4070_50360 [Nostoc commune HK-02]GBG20372.1 hypothetical protein NIES4072_40490 [Nostoc commune NIES-4072]